MKSKVIDWYRIYQRLPEIMGLEFTRKGNKWEGGYYIDGRPHPFRRDKLKATVWKNMIWIHEEGGESMSILSWLTQYGGASDMRHAYDIIEGKDKPLLVVPDYRKEIIETKYVSRDILSGLSAYPLEKCPLYRWMCSLFAEDQVAEVWHRYNVTTDSSGLAVFWYVDRQGRICHDKRVRYFATGHRDKTFGGSREFTTAKGYNARCYFGSHLIKEGESINVVESEKTAILATLYYGGTWIATGGKNALRSQEKGVFLYPDIDAAEEWREKGDVVEWWHVWEHPTETGDIGDMIVDIKRKEH